MEAESHIQLELESLLQFLYLCPVGVIRLTCSGQIEMMNAKATQLLMPIARELSLGNVFELFSDYAPELRNLVEGFGRPQGTICENHQIELPADAPRRACVLAATIIKIDGDTLMMVITDITRLVEQERMIRAREERLRAIFDGIRDYAIYTLDKDGRIDSWNQSVQRVEGYRSQDVLGKTLDFDYPVEELSSETTAFRLKMAAKIGWHEDEGWRLRRDGSKFWANSIVSVLQDIGDGCSGYSVITRDATERKRAEDSLRSLALTDPLTGAYNRRHFFEQAEKEALLAEKTGGAISFLLLDADHFKRLNDRFGHAVGDAVLKELTATCLRSLRPGDLLARHGGEEFVVMLRQTALPEALAVAERLRAAIAQCAVSSGSDEVRFTVSVGVALFQGSVLATLQRADESLYAAKQGGRDRVVALPSG